MTRVSNCDFESSLKTVIGDDIRAIFPSYITRKKKKKMCSIACDCVEWRLTTVLEANLDKSNKSLFSILVLGQMNWMKEKRRAY